MKDVTVTAAVSTTVTARRINNSHVVHFEVTFEADREQLGCFVGGERAERVLGDLGEPVSHVLGKQVWDLELEPHELKIEREVPKRDEKGDVIDTSWEERKVRAKPKVKASSPVKGKALHVVSLLIPITFNDEAVAGQLAAWAGEDIRITLNESQRDLPFPEEPTQVGAFGHVTAVG